MTKNTGNLTIILTLWDRCDFTYRWMKWMNESECPYKILIADGGKDKDIEKHLQNYSNYSNLNYEYIRYPYDENLDMYYAKVDNVHKKVTTKYVMRSDNDDFIILDYLEEKIKFLDDNSEYNSYIGEVSTFVIPNERSKSTNLVYNKNINFHYVPYDKSIEHNSPSKRSIEALKLHTLMWYSVMKTTTSVILFEEIHKAKNKIILSSEYFSLLMVPVFGKMKVDNKPHYVTQWGVSQGSEGIIYEGRHDYITRMLTLDWQYDYLQLVNCVVKHLSSIEKDFDKKIYLEQFNQAYKHNIMPQVKAQVCKITPRFLKLKTIIFHSPLLSKLVIFIQKITGKKISPLMDISKYKNEPSMLRWMNFMVKHSNINNKVKK